MGECVLCQGKTVAFSEFEKLQNVTSDSKPYPNITSLMCCKKCGHLQKDVNEKFIQCVTQIYKDYQIFNLSSGVEQVMFSESGVESRSKILASWLKDQIALTSNHSILDYGCGDCSALCSFSETFPEANLYGYEIEDIPRPKSKKLSNLKEIIISEKFEPNRKFEFISMIHCLEHIANPIETLRNIRNYLTEDGYILIEVPDVYKSTYDVLIADHVSHFSLETLVGLLEASGFEIVRSTSSAIVKELTVLAKISDLEAQTIRQNQTRFEFNNKFMEEVIRAHIETVGTCKYLLDDRKKIGIFGSSNAAMWLWGELDKRPNIFVDEDRAKYRSTPEFDIISPEMVDEGYTILVPLIADVANLILSKYSTHTTPYIAV